MDTKTALNEFCQRYCHRPVTKQDIVYTTAKFPQGYQAIVKLNCFAFSGVVPEYAGELASKQKEAEKNAANQALLGYQGVLASLPPLNGKNKRKRGKLVEPSVSSCAMHGLPPKRFKVDAEAMLANNSIPIENTNLCGEASECGFLGGTLDAFEGGVCATHEGAPNMVGRTLGNAGEISRQSTFKSDLNAACGKILRRPLTKGEIVFQVAHHPGVGYVARCTISALPGDWATRVFTGSPHPDKREAEHSVASAALAAISADCQFGALISAPKVKKPWPPPGRGLKVGGKGSVRSRGFPSARHHFNAMGGVNRNASLWGHGAGGSSDLSNFGGPIRNFSPTAFGGVCGYGCMGNLNGIPRPFNSATSSPYAGIGGFAVANSNFSSVFPHCGGGGLMDFAS